MEVEEEGRKEEPLPITEAERPTRLGKLGIASGDSMWPSAWVLGQSKDPPGGMTAVLLLRGVMPLVIGSRMTSLGSKWTSLGAFVNAPGFELNTASGLEPK